jgi:hypothetical protein
VRGRHAIIYGSVLPWLAIVWQALEHHPNEAEARAVARQLRAQGPSLRGVAAELERRGLRSRTGRGFAQVQVQVKRMVA